jgi:hypothetical protein
MKKKRKTEKSWIYWTPRLISIAFICLLAMFSLDVFESGKSASQVLIGFLIHNIPVFVLLIILGISWKYEIVGGIAFILAGLLYLVMILKNIITTGFQWYYFSWIGLISGIAFLIGILFLIGWFNKKNKSKSL